MAQQDILAVIEEAIQRYRPGGEFAKTRGEQLRETKTTYVPQARSELVSRGLAGTTMGAAIPARFEKTVAKPWRTQTEMLRGQSLMEAIMAKAGIMERAGARESQEVLVREQMEQQRELALANIRSREIAAAGGGGGAGGGGVGGRGEFERWGSYTLGGGGGGGGAGAGDTGGYGGDYGGMGRGYAGGWGAGVLGTGEGGWLPIGEFPSSTRDAVGRLGQTPDPTIGMREADPSMVPAGVTGDAGGRMTIGRFNVPNRADIAAFGWS